MDPCDRQQAANTVSLSPWQYSDPSFWGWRILLSIKSLNCRQVLLCLWSSLGRFLHLLYLWWDVEGKTVSFIQDAGAWYVNTAAQRLYFSFSKLSKPHVSRFVSVLTTRVDIFKKLCKLMFTFLSTARSLPMWQTVFPIYIALIEINFLKDSVTQSLYMRHSSIVLHQLSVLICQTVCNHQQTTLVFWWPITSSFMFLTHLRKRIRLVCFTAASIEILPHCQLQDEILLQYFHWSHSQPSCG